MDSLAVAKSDRETKGWRSHNIIAVARLAPSNTQLPPLQEIAGNNGCDSFTIIR
jgi:hypothetical protein